MYIIIIIIIIIIIVNGTEFGERQSLSVELFRSSKGFEFLKLTAKHKVLKNLKRSWKVMEFEKLERVQPCMNVKLLCKDRRQ